MTKPDDIPQDVWGAAFDEACKYVEWLVPMPAEYEQSEHVLAVSFARAILAERERWRPAITYFDRYCQDEADDVDNCVCGAQQHEDAKAFHATVHGYQQDRRR